MRKITQLSKSVIRVTVFTMVLSIILFYMYQNHRLRTESPSQSTPQHNDTSSESEHFSSTANKRKLVEQVRPVLNRYVSYLARQLDGNELESLMNSIRPIDPIDGIIRRLENSIIIAKSLSTHELTSLITGNTPVALIDGRLYKIGDTVSGCLIENITSNYVTLQKTNIQYNLRISKTLQPLINPPNTFLTRNSSFHGRGYAPDSDYPSYSFEHKFDNSSMSDSDVDLDDIAQGYFDLTQWGLFPLSQFKVASFGDTINSGERKKSGKYLGQLGGSQFNPNSTRNLFGAGNNFHPNSINNQFGKYGNEFSPNSVRNPFAINTPKLYDSQGNYRGKLSSNPYDPDSISNPYGRYGSPFSPDSINNSFGAGNPFSPDSPRNPFGQGWEIYGSE